MLPESRAVEDPLALLEQLAAAALPRWQLEARDIRLLKRRENAVFRVVDRDGRAFVLRIHHAGYHSDAALHSELRWITALQAAGVDVPAMLPAADGSLFVRVQVAGLRGERQVDLQQWIDGRQLGTSEGGLAGDLSDVASTYRTIGGIAARLHNQATAWPLPAGFERHRWDADGLVGDWPLWGRFWELEALDAGQRALLLRARDAVRRRLQALPVESAGLPRYGLIHADFVPENLLCNDQGRVRLIDFDDSGFGWHLFELATALYFLQDDPSYDIAKENLIAGYREHRALPDAVLADLGVFMAARAFTYLGWMHTRPASPESRAILPLLVRLACREAERLLDA